MGSAKARIQCPGVAVDFHQSLLDRGYSEIDDWDGKLRKQEFRIVHGAELTIIEFWQPSDNFGARLGPSKPLYDPNYRRTPVEGKRLRR